MARTGRLQQSRRGHRPPLRLPRLLTTDAHAGAIALATRAAAGGAPALAMPEPADPHAVWRAGGLAALLHAGILVVALGLVALLTPKQIAERIIPVSILREPPPPVPLPGSNEAPAPAGPKRVGAARPSAADLAAARSLTPEEAEALRRAALEAAPVPGRVERAQASAEPAILEPREAPAPSRPTALRAAPAPTAAIEMGRAAAPRIAPAQRAVIAPDSAGPRRIDAALATAAPAPEVFGELSRLGAEASATGTIAGAGAATGSAAGTAAAGIDTGVETAWQGAGDPRVAGPVPGGGAGSGGQGQARGVVACLESQAVQDYLELVRERTRSRWTLPPGTRSGSEVILRFDLDAAGMATRVDVEEGQDPALGASAVSALVAASPFPAMDDRTRCLTEKRIKTTFSVPSR